MLLATGRILTELRADFPDVDEHFDAIVAENGAVIDDYVIVGMSEEVGPQMIPGLNPDTRTVQLAFQVVVQRPR